MRVKLSRTGNAAKPDHSTELADGRVYPKIGDWGSYSEILESFS